MKTALRALLVSLALSALPATAATLADVEVISRSTGQPVPVHAHAGKLYVAGQPGERYSIRITNRARVRVLAVASVDGVNVVSGETAAHEEVAAFYFTPLPDSYAARTDRPGHVGVIGVAVFREWTPPRPRPQPRPRHYESPGSAPAEDTASQRSEQARANETEAPASPSAELGSARRGDLATLRQRERIGTGHGEREHSAIEFTHFRRASSAPNEIISIHYERYENLLARGIIPSPPRFAEPLPFPGTPRFAPDPRS